jgi:mono/diheme cytochrome c family protein
LRAEGYLAGGTWTNEYVKQNCPQVLNDGGKIDLSKLPTLSPPQQVQLGETLFLHHCNDCHAAGLGYSAVGPLLTGRSRKQVRDIIEHLESNIFMPPWAGTPEEAECLTDYLMSIAPGRPAGMRLGPETTEVQ